MKPFSRPLRRLLLLTLALSLVLLLSGCFTKSANELYSLPAFSTQNKQLQKAISALTAEGGELTSPVAGSNRQSIQQQDLDGDGTPEVLAFFRFYLDEHPLRLCAFRLAEDGTYQLMANIPGDGLEFERVSYADLDKDGAPEIILGRQVSTGINLLNVFSVTDGDYTQLLSTNYSTFLTCQLSGRSSADLLVVRCSNGEAGSDAELYMMTDGTLESEKVALTDDVTAISRIRAGLLSDNHAAVFIESTLPDGRLVTDVLTYRRELLDVTIDRNSTVSFLSRTYEIYSQDINGDGIMECPVPETLAMPVDATSASTVIRWCQLDRFGRETPVCTTFHNTKQGWYLLLPEEWLDHLTVRQAEAVAGENATTFSILNDDGTELSDFLSIYTLTGENREERAELYGRFMLQIENDTVFSARLLVDESWDRFDLLSSTVEENFNVIYTDWDPATN